MNGVVFLQIFMIMKKQPVATKNKFINNKVLRNIIERVVSYIQVNNSHIYLSTRVETNQTKMMINLMYQGGIVSIIIKLGICNMRKKEAEQMIKN